MKDIETTKKKCKKFEYKPVSIMNFLEGTRFTKAKYAAQNSPYKHLLKPKSGGIAFVLEALDGKIHKLLDITLIYEGPKSFWDFLCGRTKSVRVYIETKDLNSDWVGSYLGDEEFKHSFQNKVTELWQAKDKRMDELLK